MAFDDMYPNDGGAFNQEISDQQAAENEEKADVQASYPIIDQYIERLETRIKEADSVEKLGINSSMSTLQAQIIIEGTNKYLALLKTELDSMKEFKERYKR